MIKSRFTEEITIKVNRKYNVNARYMKKKFNKQIVIYQGQGGALELKADAGKETIWATQAQISELFGVERSVITKHIRNILKDKELDRNQVCANFAHTASYPMS